jgi:hypothetical protein
MTGAGLVDAFAAVWQEHLPAICGLAIAVPLSFLLNPCHHCLRAMAARGRKNSESLGQTSLDHGLP